MGGTHLPYKAQSPQSSEEALGVQEKIIQLKVSEGKAGQTPKELRSAEAQGTAAPLTAAQEEGSP